MIRIRSSRRVITAAQCRLSIRPMTSHRGSSIVRARTSTYSGSYVTGANVYNDGGFHAGLTTDRLGS